MEFTPEQLTAMIAIGFGAVRVAEWGAKSLYALATGKKGATEVTEKIATNHLPHLQGAIEKGFNDLGCKFDKLSERMIDFCARIDERTKAEH